MTDHRALLEANHILTCVTTAATAIPLLSNNSIISMEKGGNCKSVFARFCDISAALKKSAEADGTKLMYSEKLGYLGTCPSNLGTGLR
jgi:protein-arginine kinase